MPDDAPGRLDAVPSIIPSTVDEAREELVRLTELERKITKIKDDAVSQAKVHEAAIASLMQRTAKELEPLEAELNERSERIAAFARKHPRLAPRIRRSNTQMLPANHRLQFTERSYYDIPSETKYFAEVRAKEWPDLIRIIEEPNKKALDRARAEQLKSVRIKKSKKYVITIPGTDILIVGRVENGKRRWRVEKSEERKKRSK